MYHILFIIFVTVNLVCCDSHFNYCEVGATEKCLGDTMNMLDMGNPDSSAGYILTKYQTDYASCSDFCVWHKECFMAAFHTDDYRCQLYRKISYTHSTSPITKLFLWTCCNNTVSYDPGNRCPGFWILKRNFQVDNTIRTLDPLVEYKGITLYQCQIECLNNAICGALNYFQQNVQDRNTVNCQLIIQFPVGLLKSISSTGWDTFQWQCERNYSLPKPKTECVPRVGYPPGFWIVDRTLQPLNDTIKSLIYFYTLDFRECLSNCALYANCKAAWYSPVSYFCILEPDGEATCADSTPASNETFTVYIWQNCQQTPQQIEAVNEKSGSCVTLIDNKNTYIYPIVCGQHPNNRSNLHKCWENPVVTRGTMFSHNIFCQKNLSFRILDKLQPFSTDFKEFRNATWVRIFTGYQSFWLVNVSAHSLRPASNVQCQVFDATDQVPDSYSLKIIKRTQWFSSKSLKPETPFSKKPVKYVIITDTEVPLCNCFSIEACSNVMRRIQLALQPAFFSIPFSFVISGDGVAYEARGWDKEPAAAAGKYNPNSFAIALCGQFKSNPTVASLKAVKQLLKIAIDMKKVDENYILYVYNDLRDRDYPYDGLRKVIELWPHYRGNVEKDCKPMGNAAIFLQILLIIFCIVLIITFIHLFIRRLWHEPHCSQVRHYRIETMYGSICKKTTEVLPQILLQRMADLECEESLISPITSPVFWIEDVRPLSWRQNFSEVCSCKSAIFSTFDICRLQTKMVNVGSLVNFPEVRSCSKPLVFIFERHGDIGRECLLILHLENVCSFSRFIVKLYRNKCICDQFTVTSLKGILSDFIVDENWIEERSTTLIQTPSCREEVQQKYTFSSQPKRTLIHNFAIEK